MGARNLALTPIGAAIQAWLDENDLPREVLAKRIGTSRSTLGRWMAGTQQPRVDEAAALEEATGVRWASTSSTQLAVRTVEQEVVERVVPDSLLADCKRDLDFAANAGMKKPRDIRTNLRSAAEAGEVVIVGGAGASGTPSAPVVYAVTETLSGNTTTVYYLTPEAQAVMYQRLGTKQARRAQAGIRRKVADEAVNGPAPALDPAAIATAVASALLPMIESINASMNARTFALLERLLPANQVAPAPVVEAPVAGVVVPPAPVGYTFTQAEVARQIGLPSRGEASNLVGSWVRELKWDGVEPYSKWTPIGLPTGIKEQGQLVYSATLASALEPAAVAAAKVMSSCGYFCAGGQIVPFDPKPKSKAETCRLMREAGLAVLRGTGT